jgi:hypothetical protein
MFLSELRDWIQRHNPEKYPETIAFLDKAIPNGYRGVANAHVHEGRLKYGDPCPGLPPLAQLMRHPFVRGAKRFSSPELAKAKAKLRQVVPKRKKLVTSANLVKAKAKLRQVVPKRKRLVTSANLVKAKAKLRHRQYTNAQLVNMPAAQFLKLSPKTRARAKNLRTAAKAKAPVVAKAKNATAREPSSRETYASTCPTERSQIKQV